MRKCQPLTALAWAALLAGGLAGCGAAPGAPGSQVAPSAPTAAVATAAPAPLATPSPAAEEPTATVAQTASPAPAGPTATAAQAASSPTAPTVATTATAVLPTTAAALPTALGGASQNVPQDILTGAVADLAGRLGVAPAAISIISAEAVSWSDGSLGCPRPGMMYPQVITDGFRVILGAGGKEYAYHGDDRGTFFYCENPA